MKSSRSKLAQVIAENTLDQATSKSYIQEIAAYLITEKKVNELNSLLRDISYDWSTKGHIEVLVRSAYKINDNVRNEIIKQIRSIYPSANKVVLNESLSSNVIGGVELMFANQQLDLSIEGKLNKFKQLTSMGKG